MSDHVYRAQGTASIPDLQIDSLYVLVGRKASQRLHQMRLHA